MRREMSVVGSFYPREAKDILRYFNNFIALYDENTSLADVKTKAVIVPHAGYVFSGYTANIAYRILAKSGVKNFVVIGPSHRVAFDGVSMCASAEYLTPFGPIAKSELIYEVLERNFGLSEKITHAEHSTEVQFPFIKHYMSDAKVVELVYGKESASSISKMIDLVLGLEDCGVIISTDLSHFYNEEYANRLDNICIEAIQKLDLSLLHQGCEACGILGVEAMMMSVKKEQLEPILLDYRTSSDASGDESSVVGYMSACFV
ncbi:MAG: AmmeMemoRadiSam system protein B [Sulfurimonas sp.]|uniref:AmmeMemoRadiSam system protein B n=1 Tax=Sulfurimonas sp. TaxID=2022749 RepID=UPI0025EC6955|nr:AmmeMemoRadiSam system protein B [Sulfurimonas sp.]MCK9491662.1 AmmeMemoRadiSam system protein B [Sulfurimonas sp.]